MLGPIGKFIVIFAAAVVVLGIIGILMLKSKAAKKDGAQPEEEIAMPPETVENVNDLADRFNRARYMDRDGGQDRP